LQANFLFAHPNYCREQGEEKMNKKLKIILVLAVFFIAVFAAFSLVIYDVAGSLATDTHPLPNGNATGKALIVYSPGLTGGAKDVATKIGYNLQESGYYVTLAGVKSSAAADITNYDLVVVGGPIYAGRPANTIQAYLNSLSQPAGVEVGVFGYGSVQIDNADQTAVMADVANLPSDSTLFLTAVAKITNSDDVDAKCQQFVTNLLK
jgi:flavodoxin